MRKVNNIFYGRNLNSSLLLNFLLCFILFSSSSVSAQSSRKLIHEGNKQYEQKKFNEAEINYRKSLNTKENEFIGNYNLGNTFYQQGKYDEAKQQFEIAAGSKEPNKKELSNTYHNLGNTLLKNNKYEESIEAYKQSLKLNPSDNDTRYNLAYAKSKLQQQQNKDNKQDKNKDQKKDDKSQQQKDKEQEQKDKEQQQKDQQAKQDESKKENQEKQANKDKISKEDAEKILQALNNDEKKTQKKMNVKERVKVSIEKEW
jgi:tetratricopeptide (TPR) repeat protein